ncbi:MAG: hypothetical protein Q8O63_00610 [Hoeflea sp.]|nr:hypothetical protein [Hoeflea sp.]
MAFFKNKPQTGTTGWTLSHARPALLRQAAAGPDNKLERLDLAKWIKQVRHLWRQPTD